MEAILIRPPQMPGSPVSDPVLEANHRIANSLALLVGMVRMEASAAGRRDEAFSAAEMRLALHGIAARIGTIGQLHRLLSQGPQDGVTNLRPHLAEVGNALVAALSSPGQLVRVEIGGEECLVPTRQVQPLVLILCEVFINAMKYAHPTGVPLILTTDCACGADGRLTILFSDDGVGLPEGFDPLKDGGLGFRVIRSLATELGAELNIESSALGLCFCLVLPATGMSGVKLS
jgi:two-component sensor histidine kinase